MGLVGATENNPKTENTDEIVRRALLKETTEDWIAIMHREKYRVSPNCETCQYPCGNTSDYPMDKLECWMEKPFQVKEQVVNELQRIAENSSEGTRLPEIVYKAISYLRYDMQDDSYESLLEEIKKYE